MRSSVLLCVVLFCLSASAQTHPGAYSGHKRDGNCIIVSADSTSLRCTFYTPDILRIDYLPSKGSTVDSSFVVIQSALAAVPVAVHDADSVLVIASAHIRLSVHKTPLRIAFADSTGRLMLAESASGGLSVKGEERTIAFTLQKGDHFYGTGERGTSLDKRGQKFESYNTQVPGYSTPVATMNLNVPFLATTSGFALFIDNIYRGRFDLGATDPSAYSYTAAGGELSFYVIASKSIPGQLEKYTWLTGRQPLPPRWMFGFTQSKNRYEDEREARAVVRTMRAKQIPCDGLVLDLKWFDAMGDVSWNEASWPHHEAMIADFLAQGIKTILITEPYIIEPSRNFAEADANGYLAKNAAGTTYLLDKWWSCGGTCSSSLLDMTNPAARQWWWGKHPAAFGAHVAGIWTDLGEPERHPEGMVHHLGDAEKVHNIYNLLWAKTIFEGFSALRPGERVVNLTRSGFAGIQRFGVLPWSGDVARSFGGLGVQLPMVLNMGMSGIAYHNSDIGGYSRMPTTPELYIRWMQYGTFCPIARAHGAGEVVRGTATEPWQFGPAAESICRDFIRLRYRLLPYIYTMAYRNYESGLPLARPLFWLDPADTTLLNESSSYMWGDALLVSPVVEAGQRVKNVHLPKGTWYNFWTDEIVVGGQVLAVSAPLEQMPIFVKAGSMLPMAPAMNYSDERTIDTLSMRVYPAGNAPIVYTLYEDDGTSLGYQTGKHALTTFTYTPDSMKTGGGDIVSIGRAQGTYAGHPDKRVYVLDIRGIRERPSAMECNGKPLKERPAPGGMAADENGFYFDRDTHSLVAVVSARTDGASTMHIVY